MNQPQNLNISLDQTTAVTCDSCGHSYMKEVMLMRKVSGILTGTGQPSYIPIPAFACDKCGHVNKEFLPPEIRPTTLE
jgi:uncharacterized Zn finger protein